MTALFRDRYEAGRQLLARIRPLVGSARTVVLGIPNGGVPVAAEIARGLHAAHDVFVVRKLRVPGHESVVIGALATGGSRVLDENVIEAFRVRADVLHEVTASELRHLEAIERDLRPPKPYPYLRDAIVVLVDDAVESGGTMLAAIQALHGRRPRAVIVAAPVMERRARDRLWNRVNACVTLAVPERCNEADSYYGDAAPTDAIVREILATDTSAKHHTSPAPTPASPDDEPLPGTEPEVANVEPV